MTYIPKTAGQGELEPKANQQSPQDAKPDGYTSPWRGAAIGGTLGGLLTTALGYLYGHRGRWLAYDAIAGGSVGAGGGYAVYAHNNDEAKNKVVSNPSVGPSVAAYERRWEELDQKKRLDHQKAVDERKEVNSKGGYAGWWADFVNTLKGGRQPDYDKWKHERSQNAAQAISMR